MDAKDTYTTLWSVVISEIGVWFLYEIHDMCYGIGYMKEEQDSLSKDWVIISSFVVVHQSSTRTQRSGK